MLSIGVQPYRFKLKADINQFWDKGSQEQFHTVILSSTDIPTQNGYIVNNVFMFNYVYS